MANVLIDRTEWTTFSEEQKHDKVASWLTELSQIDDGDHILHNTKDAGKLTEIKKQLNSNVLQALSWENSF